ncbi:MAG: PTS sugar transporter subunit IIA [Erysipelotrichaceae bacterium]|jgi:mannose/fructose-specific phosphotransferase system component IIA|uniref:PTS sugar transporter subunit IIA n=1 Tax=Grylomicrobium aquisgranensis TaxID=2926318 RepID=A0AB35U4T6_9FIRM|nr:PTS sugar transporter subunit IIA [Erysipelotrichaceae bacterium]MCI1326307.1 PTS sugar transporter subunit IIA [Solobacterium sp.]MDX8420583.1 PTS sugar transporter subunit IIA [Stecheria sp. CLA-KB-P133]MCH4044043.1 PTS sugar transporter subunit IIA [Erysipelotrichaceae bacterium]MCH4121258.1 PTS sugar transporter subunit IIA [Erysipelotrichaceae bacterium]
MLKLFLSSHGHFASGMKSSIDILSGSSDRLTVFDAYVNQENVADQLNAFYQTVKDDDQVILLSDLYGGSVNQQMYLFLNRPNTRLIAGVNLALVLELSIRDSISDEDLEKLVAQSREMLRIVKNNQDDTEESNTADDFF